MNLSLEKISGHQPARPVVNWGVISRTAISSAFTNQGAVFHCRVALRLSQVTVRAVYFKDQQLEIIEHPRPMAGEGEAVIQVTVAGICRTDLEQLAGYYHFSGIPGHEFVGRVIDAPSRPDLLGRRVTSEINIGCGKCVFCARGEKEHCYERKVIGIKNWEGAFAEYVKTPLSNIHPVPDSITDEAAVFVEPLAAALRITQQIHITADCRAAVLGDGKLGLLAALAIGHYTPWTVLFGKHRDRLSLAREWGLTTRLVEMPSFEQTIDGAAGAFDLVVEATGQAGGIRSALKLVRPRGDLVVKTTSRHLAEIDLSDIVVREIRITGSRCGDFEHAMMFLKHKWLAVEALITARYEFEAFQEALSHAARPGCGKVLVYFNHRKAN